MRWMRDTGNTTRAFAEVAVAHRYHATLNPKAIMRKPMSIEDHQRSRWVSAVSLLDCCLETGGGADHHFARARLQPAPAAGFIMGGIARMTTPSPMWNYSRPEIHYVAGNYGRNRLFGWPGSTRRTSISYRPTTRSPSPA
jgi:acetyl-CoA acetyltransferase